MTIQTLLFCLLNGRSNEMQFVNLALKKPANQSSDYHRIPNYIPIASKAVDGVTSGKFDRRSCTHTSESEAWHWWMVDLEANYTIRSIRIYNRLHRPDRLKNFSVEVSMDNPRNLTGFPQNALNADVCFSRELPIAQGGPHVFNCSTPVSGRYVRVVKKSPKWSPLTLCEFEVYGTPFNGTDSHSAIYPAGDNPLKENLNEESTTTNDAEDESAMDIDAEDKSNMNNDQDGESTTVKKVKDETMGKTGDENGNILEKWQRWNTFIDEYGERLRSGERFSTCDHECC